MLERFKLYVRNYIKRFYTFLRVKLWLKHHVKDCLPENISHPSLITVKGFP